MTCKKCGYQNPKEATVCKMCGSDINSKKGKRKKFTVTVLLIVFFICFIVAACMIGYRMYTQQLQKELSEGIENAQESFEQKDYAETLHRLDSLKDNKFYDSSLSALLLEGKSAMELEKYDEAIVCFENALEIEKNEEAILNLGVCYAREGKEDAALDVLEKNSVGEGVAEYIQGEIYFKEKNTDAAITSFESVTEKSENDDLKLKAYIMLSQIYKDLRHGDKENYYYLNKQIDVMEEAVRELEVEDDLTLTEMMGEAYFTAQEYDLSVIKFNRLLELGYNRPYIYRNIAIIYQQTGELEEAEEILLEMKEKYPEDYTCYMQLGFVYLEIENAKPESARNYEIVEKNYDLAVKYADSQNESGLVQLGKLVDSLKNEGWL